MWQKISWKQKQRDEVKLTAMKQGYKVQQNRKHSTVHVRDR